MKRFTSIALIFACLIAPAAQAEPATPTPPGIRASIASARFDDSGGGARRYFVTQPPRKKNSPAAKASAAFVMGFLGTLPGAFVGAALSDCHCSEPFLTNSTLVGAAVGAVGGGILGWWLAAAKRASIAERRASRASVRS